MPIYVYKNLKTGKVYEEYRKMDDADAPFYDENNELCERVLFPGGGKIIDKNGEVFKRFPDEVKSGKPKYIKFQDGHKEKYDPTKHC